MDRAEVVFPLVVQIWDHDGQFIHRSGPEVDMPLQPRSGYVDVKAGADHWRVFQSNDQQHAVQISQRWSAREEIANHAAAGAALPFLVAIPLAWLLIRWSVKRVLLELGHLAEDIGRRSTDAKESLSPTGIPVEIVPLIGAMNSLIGRHQEALAAQRRFVSDAAHELRTPLAALQIQIDNLRSRDLISPVREMVSDLLGGIRRAVYSVNQLLTMARADALPESAPETIDIGLLIRFVLSSFVSIAEEKGVRLSTQIEEGVRLTTRASDVQLILSNVIDNAIRYSGPDGKIGILARRVTNVFRIEIIDGRCGIPQDALPHLYDRFFRAAPPDIEGSGLGLAIAKVAADRNALCLIVKNRTDALGVRAVIDIPSNRHTKLSDNAIEQS